jgi:hypothetical protein
MTRPVVWNEGDLALLMAGYVQPVIRRHPEITYLNLRRLLHHTAAGWGASSYCVPCIYAACTISLVSEGWLTLWQRRAFTPWVL